MLLVALTRPSPRNFPSVSPQPRGPQDFPIGGLEPRRFESLVYLLARAVDSLVVPVRVRDHGLDARLPDPRGRTIRGWQAKRFTGAINWQECRTSVRRALAFWRPTRITFCFPRELSGGEQESFRTELIERFPEVRLDFWPGGELQRLIRDTDEGRRAAAWLFENPGADREAMMRAIAVGGELADTRQAAERQAVIQGFLDRDPHIHYTMVSRSPGAPATPPADQTFLSVTLLIDGQEVRIDASTRFGGALEDLGAVPQLAFTDDEAGRRALRALQRLDREGGDATISAGLGAVMPTVPTGLRGLMPEAGLWGEVEVTAEATEAAAPPPFRQPVVVRAGGVQIGMVLAEAEPAPEWDRTLHAAAGGVELFLSLRGPQGKIDPRLDWRYTPGQGTGLEQLLGARLMVAALRGELVEIVQPADGHLLISGTLDAPDDAAVWRQSLETREAFLGYVAELEAWLGSSLEPPADPELSDAEVLSTVIPLIREPHAEITWQRVEVASGATPPSREDGPFRFALLQPLHAQLFGQQVYVGMQMLSLPEGLVEGEEPGPIAIVPVGETGTGTSRLHHPDEAPPDVAIRPDQPV